MHVKVSFVTIKIQMALKLPKYQEGTKWKEQVTKHRKKIKKMHIGNIFTSKTNSNSYIQQKNNLYSHIVKHHTTVKINEYGHGGI